jgi:putative membrane protein
VLLTRVLPGVTIGQLDLSPASRRARYLRPVGWRHLTAGAEESLFAATRGWVRRELVLMPHAKPQSVRITQGPVQRRLGLANVGLDTTKGPVSVVAMHRDAHDARMMLDREVELERRARAAAAPDRWELVPRHSPRSAEPLRQSDANALHEPTESAEPSAVEQLGGRPSGGERA